MQQGERGWLRLAIKGDAQAFSRIVEIYSKPVYNLCYRILGNAEDAEDAAQETFIRAFKAIKRYDPQRRFATWLLSIAANYCIDQYRRLRPVMVELEDAPAEYLADRNPGPEMSLIRSEAGDEVQDMLVGSLDSRDRAAVMLYYWYDHSYEEIGEMLNISETALKSRLHRARKSLARAWSEKESKSVIATRRTRETAAL